jgi:hypothetical protein
MAGRAESRTRTLTCGGLRVRVWSGHGAGAAPALALAGVRRRQGESAGRRGGLAATSALPSTDAASVAESYQVAVGPAVQIYPCVPYPTHAHDAQTTLSHGTRGQQQCVTAASTPSVTRRHCLPAPSPSLASKDLCFGSWHLTDLPATSWMPFVNAVHHIV